MLLVTKFLKPHLFIYDFFMYSKAVFGENGKRLFGLYASDNIQKHALNF